MGEQVTHISLIMGEEEQRIGVSGAEGHRQAEPASVRWTAGAAQRHVARTTHPDQALGSTGLAVPSVNQKLR